MRKKLLPFIAIIMLAFVGACSNEDVLPEIGSETNPELTGRTLSFTASMPDEDGPSTRVSVEEGADRTIALTWQANDKIDLLFVQNTNKINESITVESVDATGKNATFTVVIPEGINEAESFNLYGVYGGGELSSTNPELIKLPAIEGTTLNEENVGKKVMLRFMSTIDPAGTVGTVNFNHIGFLFTTKIKVTAGSVNDITSVQLVGADDVNGTWAYNASENHFDMEPGTFTAVGTGNNTVSFQNAVKDAENNILTVRNWFPAIGTAWPALQLSINDGTIKTFDTKPSRTPAVGKAYYLYATWDGTDLAFDDKGTKENPYTVAEAFSSQGKNNVWIKGYIVGYKKSGGYSVEFNTTDASGTNIIIADNKDETDGTKALGIQLLTGDARTDLNLASNPHMYKAEVLLYGDLGGYFSGDEGLLNVTNYELISSEPFFISDETEITFQASGDALSSIIAITTHDATQAWTATSEATWLTIAPAAGTGNGTVTVTAEVNTETVERTATITLTPIGGASLTPIIVTVTQVAAGEIVRDGLTKETAYITADIAGNQGQNGVWVRAFIVGSDNSGLKFETGPSASGTNIIISDNKDASTEADIVRVALPSGAGRTNLNLKAEFKFQMQRNSY